MMIRYDMPTPKHFTAMARSNHRAAFGKVRRAHELNEAERPVVWAAQRPSRKRPIPEAKAEKAIMKKPGIKPMELTA